MLKYEIHRDPVSGEEWIETDLRGKELLITYLLNKSTAFTHEERCQLGLLGKLPAKIETLEEQVTRAYQQYRQYDNDLQKHIYLNNLHDKNEVLFYKLVNDHLVEMMPIVYTPVVGKAVQMFNQEFRQPRGLYISFEDQHKLDEIIENRTHPEVSIVVVTDGERVLGIGDQGIGAIHIPIAKLILYTMCGGINPYFTLPIVLDVGTNNEKHLNDPFYLGSKHPRITGEQYDQFIEKFVSAIQKHMPNTFLHWEDFGRDNARRILETYRNRLCTFNDDMQGTSVVTTAALLTAIKKSGDRLADQRIVIFGAGTAGVGIADNLVDAMVREGIAKEDAEQRIWLIDRFGLLGKDSPNLAPFQVPYLKESGTGMSLEEVVTTVKPSVLIGCSAMGNAFSEKVVRVMAANVTKPIIFPLSNPNERSEADPADLLQWTQNKALVATGSPFKGFAQCNNAFSFPGIGLGVIASRAKHVTDNMLWAACIAISRYATNHSTEVLPPLSEARKVAYEVAIAVVEAARQDKVARIRDEISAEEAVKSNVWEPYYRPVRPRKIK